MVTGTITDPGYRQRKGMYNDDAKAVNSFTVAVPLKGIVTEMALMGLLSIGLAQIPHYMPV